MEDLRGGLTSQVRHTVLGLSVVGFVLALENSKTDLRAVFRGTYYAVYKRKRPHQFTREIPDNLIPKPKSRDDRRGRPWKDRRAVLNGILWVLRTGAPWADVPDRYPSHQTCHRRFQQWVRSGVMRGVLEALAADLKIRARLT